MRKKLILIVLSILLIAGSAYAFRWSQGSGELTSDTAVVTSECYITSIHIITDGTNDAKIILYDNASAASGTVRFEMTVTGADNYGGKSWAYPKRFTNGIFADVSGTGASYIIEYLF